MAFVIRATTFCAALALAGCASLFGPPPQPGEPVEAVVAKLGQPKGVYPEPDGGQVFDYPMGPAGQFTYMARFDKGGRLLSYEQVLTNERFSAIKVDRATKEDVLRTVGRPSERSYLPLGDYEVWSYRYKESGVWNSVMHVHFDRQGIVRKMLNGPDPVFEERRFFR